jgi:hypothetical protein
VEEEEEEEEEEGGVVVVEGEGEGEEIGIRPHPKIYQLGSIANPFAGHRIGDGPQHNSQ